MTAVFWGAFAFGRFAAIFMAIYVNPLKTLLASLALCLCGGVSLVFLAQHSLVSLQVTEKLSLGKWKKGRTHCGPLVSSAAIFDLNSLLSLPKQKLLSSLKSVVQCKKVPQRVFLFFRFPGSRYLVIQYL